MATSPEAASEVTHKVYRKTINSWCLYDWANSAFVTTIVATIGQAFYIEVAGKNLGPVQAGNYWGFTNSAAMLLVACVAPILGAMADHSGARKRFLGGFAGLGILFTTLLVFPKSGSWLWMSMIYIVARIGFAGGNIFYDSLLPHVALRNDIDQVSARGYAMGYLGGGLLLAINVAMIYQLGPERGARFCFLTVAVWWAVFSIPIFRRVAEPPAMLTGAESPNPVRAGFQRLRRTFREIRRYRQLLIFLLAFWLYNDGIGTIWAMGVAFGKGLDLEAIDLVKAILAVQFIGVPCAFAFGWLARRLGTKGSILLGLSVYTAITVGAFAIITISEFTVFHFWLMAVGVGLVQGGTQALSRSLFGAMSPKAKASEFFGFYNMSSKFATILGPFVYGLVGALTGEPRWSIVSIAIFFAGGAVLLLCVNVKEGIRVAKEEDAAHERNHG